METEPRLIRSRNGWLAVSPAGHSPRIGTVGSTEDEATQSFQEELAAWTELHSRPDTSPTRQSPRT